jgi:hypothetical protein
LVGLSVAGAAVGLTWYLVAKRRRNDGADASLAARLMLSAIDLRRRPSPDSRAGFRDAGHALAAWRRPDPPRVLPFVTVKRTNPRLGTFGHWWVEIDGVESYGWWPGRCPLRMRHFLFGGRGALNGTGGACSGGSTSRDPHHHDSAEHSFHPVLTARKSDRRVRAEIRSFATAYDAGWRWRVRPETDDCRTFQVRLMRAAGLADPEGSDESRGRGCPFLALFGPRTRALA